jgi:hypothetical protein
MHIALCIPAWAAAALPGFASPRSGTLVAGFLKKAG